MLFVSPPSCSLRYALLYLSPLPHSWYTHISCSLPKLTLQQFLAAANILPSYTESYAAADIIATLRRGHKGMTPIIQCRYGALDEIWYYFDVRGSVQTGEFVPQNPVAASSRCPSSGIRYLPKKKRL